MLRAIWPVLLAAVVLLSAFNVVKADEGPRWEWQPYRVRAILTSDSLEGQTGDRWRSAGADLASVVERVVGPGWDFSVERANSYRSHTLLDGIGPWSLLPDAKVDAADVWLWIDLADIRGQTRWQLRAWQPELESVSPVIDGTTWDDRTVPDRLLRSAWKLFRPVARIDVVDGSDVRLQLRAGELPPADPDLAWVHEGDLLEAAIVFGPQGTSPGQRREIPWTILEVSRVERATLYGQVHSGLRQALNARSRGRMQQHAAVIRPWYEETEVTLQTWGSREHRLSGSRVTIVESLGENSPPPVELLTDRLGHLRLVQDETRLKWLTVWSGQQRLARVPVVAGARQHLVLEVPDDSVRLGVEGQLQILQDRLVDAVAARNALLISLRKLAKQERWEAVDTGLQRLGDLPGPSSFLQDLTGIRVPAVQEARRQKNRGAEVRVNRLCDDTATMIREHLSDEKLKVFREELAELQRAAKAGIAAPPEASKPGDR